MVKYAIIASDKDPAGMNIKEKLLSVQGFEAAGGSFDGYGIFSRGPASLYTLKTDTVFAERIDEKIEADYYIFATRHEASAGMPTLSVHAPGNFGAANFGGDDNKICPAPARLLKTALISLSEYNLAGYTVTMEATHHGPYMEKPAMFIEIGSCEAAWRDEKAGRAIALVISNLINSTRAEDYEPAAAIGGSHYCPAFNKIMLDSSYAIGHVCPKYSAEKLDEAMILQMADKTVPRARTFFIDWKGVGSAVRSNTIAVIEKLGFEYRRA